MAPRTYWHKQGTKPLYPDVIWSKPENKQAAGKLLIIGGHAYGFSAPALFRNRSRSNRKTPAAATAKPQPQPQNPAAAPGGQGTNGRPHVWKGK